MSGLATKIPDDQWMARPRKSDDYVPPDKASSVMLSEALRGTGRFPANPQLNMLGSNRERGDIRIYFAGDLALASQPLRLGYLRGGHRLMLRSVSPRCWGDAVSESRDAGVGRQS